MNRSNRPFKTIVAALALSVAIPAGCDSSGTGTSGETHFLACTADADCASLEGNYACIEGVCQQSPDASIGSGGRAGTGGTGNNGGTSAGSGASAASGGFSQSGGSSGTAGASGTGDGGAGGRGAGGSARDASSEAASGGLGTDASAGGAPASGGSTSGGATSSGGIGGSVSSGGTATGGDASPASGGGGGSDASVGGSGGFGADAGAVELLSCTGGGDGLSNCGLSGSESCCESPLVAGGTFLRSYDGVTYKEQGNPATVSDFRLDKYEVTVGRFRKFVSVWVGGWRPAAGAGKHTHLNGGNGLVSTCYVKPCLLPGPYETGWDPTVATSLAKTATGWDTNLSCGGTYKTWTSVPGSNERRPIGCMTADEAAAFCIWDGGFLPSEAEWNYAASGGNEQRQYPWGSADPGTDATLAIFHCYYAGTGTACTGVENIAPVGSAPAGNGKFGQADLAGSAYELTMDWGLFQPWYPSPCIDCAVLKDQQRMIRGGLYASSSDQLLTSARSSGPGRGAGFGFRCARSP